MSWYLEPTYSAAEVLVIILLAALPMSQIAQIALGVVQDKTGIDTNPAIGEAGSDGGEGDSDSETKDE